ncbi:MAG TPA: hypothetical protein VEK05_09740 [Burkholderiales bacterium]|nr:hypothetical protein [Burkholderiales bacterium]
MRALFLAATVLSLAACANAPSSTSRSVSWWDYRQQVMQDRNHGDLTPVAAEEKVAAKYREIYGLDPEMEGVFAYDKRLYEMAENGTISVGEADTFALARIDQILARNAADVEYHNWLESRFPPNGGD